MFLDKVKPYIHSVEKYEVKTNKESLNITKKEDSFLFHIDNLNIEIPIDKFKNILNNPYSTIKHDNFIFKINKPNKFDNFISILLSNGIDNKNIEIISNSIHYKELLNHLNNTNEYISISKTNDLYNIIIGNKNDVLNFNIHNIFNGKLKTEELLEILNYYKDNNSNIEISLYDNEDIFFKDFNILYIMKEKNYEKYKNDIEKLMFISKDIIENDYIDLNDLNM